MALGGVFFLWVNGDFARFVLCAERKWAIFVPSIEQNSN
jgi:hypothetical protein